MAEQGTTPGGRRGYAGTWPPRTAVPAGGFAPSRPAIWPPLIETLRRWVRAEAGAGRLLPWVPIAFGTGIAFYFAADHEPVLAVAAIAAIALCATAPRGRLGCSHCRDVRRPPRALRWRPEHRADDYAWRGRCLVQLTVLSNRDARAHRSFCAACRDDGKSARADQTRARAVVC